MNKIIEYALIMHNTIDQIAIAKRHIKANTQFIHKENVIQVKEDIIPGMKFALCDIPSGEYVCQYGHPFGCSKGISKGEKITSKCISNEIPSIDLTKFARPPATKYDNKLSQKTFQGFLRNNNQVGTRNIYAVIPTSMCAVSTAEQIVNNLEKEIDLYSQIDNIVCLSHTEGCGCDSTISIDRLLLIIKNYIIHPNIGGVFLLDLGCEQTNYDRVSKYLKDVFEENIKPIDWLTIEEFGGVEKSRKEAIKIIKSRLPDINNIERTPFPISRLIIGTECGASDTFSGITANPLIGTTVDKIIKSGGSAILSEITEMIGTFDVLLPRFKNVDTAKRFKQTMDWYIDLGHKLGHDLTGNLVPKNIEGGLINIFIKSLGAITKGGTSIIEDILDYGERIKEKGLNIMQGPGGDLESVTGLVASGANIICFSTGQGTPTGNAICPVIKIASNSKIYKKLKNDLDFNAGRLLSESIEIEKLSEELVNEIIEVASGKKTASERLYQYQFQIWTAGKLSL